MTRLEQLRRERGLSYNTLAILTGNVATGQTMRTIALGHTKRPRYETARALEAVFTEHIDRLLAEADVSQPAAA